MRVGGEGGTSRVTEKPAESVEGLCRKDTDVSSEDTDVSSPRVIGK